MIFFIEKNRYFYYNNFRKEVIMGLFGKSKDYKQERKEIKKNVDKLMKQYDKGKIDGNTYFKKNDGVDIFISR